MGAATVRRIVVADERASTTSHRRPKMRDVEKEYRRLLLLWQKEREKFSLSSNTYDYWEGPSGKGIIALGPAIIPYLIQELRNGGFLAQCSPDAHNKLRCGRRFC